MNSRSLSAVLLLVLAVSAPAPAAAQSETRSVRDAVELGLPSPVSVSFTELVVEVPVRVKPVGVGGKVHRLDFAEMKLNGIPFEVDPYEAAFDLPEKEAVTLREPLRLRLRFASVAPGLVEEALAPSEQLRLTGKVTLDASLRKWIFSTRRKVAVPMDVTGRNPLADYHPLKLALEQMKRLEQRGWRLPF